MRNEDFYKLVQEARKEQDSLLVDKGADYADQGVFGDEKLANFKEVAKRLAGAPLDATTICAVYWLKHVIAIERWVRDRKVSSEPIEGRFDDESNYNLLLRANAQEYQDGTFGPAPLTHENIDLAVAYTKQAQDEEEDWHGPDCEDIDCTGCWVAGEPEPGIHRTCGCDVLGINCLCGTNEEEGEEVNG
jgi:hypothetical protein